jgi:hypothetical protein
METQYLVPFMCETGGIHSSNLFFKLEMKFLYKNLKPPNTV